MRFNGWGFGTLMQLFIFIFLFDFFIRFFPLPCPAGRVLTGNTGMIGVLRLYIHPRFLPLYARCRRTTLYFYIKKINSVLFKIRVFFFFFLRTARRIRYRARFVRANITARTRANTPGIVLRGYGTDAVQLSNISDR